MTLERKNAIVLQAVDFQIMTRHEIDRFENLASRPDVKFVDPELFYLGLTNMSEYGQQLQFYSDLNKDGGDVFSHVVSYLTRKNDPSQGPVLRAHYLFDIPYKEGGISAGPLYPLDTLHVQRIKEELEGMGVDVRLKDQNYDVNVERDALVFDFGGFVLGATVSGFDKARFDLVVLDQSKELNSPVLEDALCWQKFPSSFDEFKDFTEKFSESVSLLICAAHKARNSGSPFKNIEFKLAPMEISTILESKQDSFQEFLEKKYKPRNGDLGSLMVNAPSIEISLFRKIVQSREKFPNTDGVELICHYDGNVERWEPHPEGVVIQSGKRLYLDGIEQIGSEDWDLWFSSPLGINFVQYGYLIRENGQILTQGGTDPLVVMEPAVSGKHISRSSLPNMKGGYVNYQTKLEMWGPNPCSVIRKDDTFYLGNIADNKILYSGEWDDWRAYNGSVIIQKGDKLFRNGTRLLFEGKIDSWNVHALGIIVQKDNQLLLNGAVVYQGEFEEWSIHSYGIVVRKGPDWYWVPNKYFAPTS